MSLLLRQAPRVLRQPLRLAAHAYLWSLLSAFASSAAVVLLLLETLPKTPTKILRSRLQRSSRQTKRTYRNPKLARQRRVGSSRLVAATGLKIPSSLSHLRARKTRVASKSKRRPQCRHRSKSRAPCARKHLLLPWIPTKPQTHLPFPRGSVEACSSSSAAARQKKIAMIPAPE
jgi:hypothetical protein